MNSIFALSILICLVIAVEGNCFIKGQPEKHIDDDMKRLSAPTLKKCQEKTSTLHGQDVEKCINKTLEKAAKDCSKENTGKDEKSWYICFATKLGSEKPTDEEMSFDYFKKELLSFTEENSKKAVSDELEKCKADPNFWGCGYKKLAEGPCPELKSLNDRMEEWKKPTE